jgi:hypothetical protein
MHFLGHWAGRLAWKETAEEFRTSWDKVHDAVEYLVTWGLEHRVLGAICAIGVEEIQRGKGHKYPTLVYQIYSVISGFYEVPTRRVLGERWNGDSDSPVGFPNVAGYPIWHVVPTFLERFILHAILDELPTHPHAGSPEYVLDELGRINQTHAA